MGCFYKLNGFKHVVLFSILCSFSLAVVTPPFAYGQINIGFNDINFGVKVQRLIDKAWKCYNRSDSNGLLNAVLDIKSEVEAHTGKKININKEIDKIESDLKKRGSKPPKDIFKQFKNLIHSKEKKKNHRALCMESYFIEQPAMCFHDYELLHLGAVNKKQDGGKYKMNYH